MRASRGKRGEEQCVIDERTSHISQQKRKIRPTTSSRLTTATGDALTRILTCPGAPNTRALSYDFVHNKPNPVEYSIKLISTGDSFSFCRERKLVRGWYMLWQPVLVLLRFLTSSFVSAFLLVRHRSSKPVLFAVLASSLHGISAGNLSSAYLLSLFLLLGQCGFRADRCPWALGVLAPAWANARAASDCLRCLDDKVGLNSRQISIAFRRLGSPTG
jgi:hypothetical protein